MENQHANFMPDPSQGKGNWPAAAYYIPLPELTPGSGGRPCAFVWRKTGTAGIGGPEQKNRLIYLISRLVPADLRLFVTALPLNT